MQGGSAAGNMWGGPNHLIPRWGWLLSFGEQGEATGFRVRVPPGALPTPAQDSMGPAPGAAQCGPGLLPSPIRHPSSLRKAARAHTWLHKPSGCGVKLPCLSFPISRITPHGAAVRMK